MFSHLFIAQGPAKKTSCYDRFFSEINKRTGEVKLNPHLTFNDGALASFIADKEKIDKTEAQNQVSKFTREIKNQLDKGESYDIFEFGTIFKNEKGMVTKKNKGHTKIIPFVIRNAHYQCMIHRPVSAHRP